MAHGKLGLRTEGEMVVRMRVKGSTSHFLQWDFLHKCFFLCVVDPVITQPSCEEHPVFLPQGRDIHIEKL